MSGALGRGAGNGKNHKFGLYYHDTGTGKTCQIIRHYTDFIGKVGAILVIVPNVKSYLNYKKI